MESLKGNIKSDQIIVEDSPNPIIILQGKKIVYINAATMKIMKATRKEQLIGKSICQFTDPFHKESCPANPDKVTNENTMELEEKRLVALDGKLLDLEINAMKIAFNNKPAMMYIGKEIAINKTENKRLIEVMDQLSESQRIYKTLFENANDIVVLFEINPNQQPSKFINVNRTACKKLGYSLDEFLSLSPVDITPKSRLKHVPNLLSKITKEGTMVFEGSYISKSGDAIPLEFNASLLELNEKKVILSIGRDISERKKLENQLKENEKRYRNLVELAPVGIAIHQFGIFKYINRAGAKKLGAEKPSDLLNRNVLEFIPPDYHQIVKGRWDEIIQNGEIVESLEGKMIRTDHKVIDVEISGIPLINNDEKLVQIFFKDITAQKESKNLMHQMAYYDSLTSLPNRRFLYDYLDRLIADPNQSQQPLSVLFVDLDGFKAINDNLSHETGDLLLKQVADRLKKNVSKNDTVSRLGGDEFIIVIENADKERAAKVAEQIVKEISKSYQLNMKEAFVTTSIGVSFYPHDGLNAETLITKADNAMYMAKNKGKNNYQFYKERSQ